MLGRDNPNNSTVKINVYSKPERMECNDDILVILECMLFTRHFLINDVVKWVCLDL